jgi:hypothetical protein
MAQLQAVEEEEVLNSKHNSAIDSEECEVIDRTKQYVNSQNELLSMYDPEFIPYQKTGKQNRSDPHEISTSRNKEPDTNNNVPCMDFPKFLVKKDLLKKLFHKFNDKPEHNTSWKYKFQSIVGEVQTTPAVEIDLLLRWAGKESSKQVLSIKVANRGR